MPQGFPGGTVVESLPANAGDMGSSPGLGGSHMPQSNWAREPQLLSLRVWSLCSATREAAIVRGPRTAMKSGPRSLQLEKALAQKRRRNTAKNKLKKKKKAQENIFNITNHKRNANQNHNGIPLHPLGWLLSKNKKQEALKRMWRNWNAWALLVGMQNAVAAVKNSMAVGTSLALQWLGLGTFTRRARVQSLVKELRSCKLCGAAKNKTKQTKTVWCFLVGSGCPPERTESRYSKRYLYPHVHSSIILFLINLFIYLFLAALGLRCRAWAFSS